MNTKTCFIENDFTLDEDDEHHILRAIWRKNKNNTLVFTALFNIIIVGANQKRKEVWNAINECDYIFINTAFIGESSDLLVEMCELALMKGIKNKCIINFRNRNSYLQLSERGTRLLQILYARNNVKYISQDSEDFKIIAERLFK